MAGAVEAGTSDWAWAQLFANVATILGFFVAIFAGVVALRAYISNARAAANAQMHGLFRDYLRLRFDYASHTTDEDATAKTHGEKLLPQLAGLKLYALEEMYVWTRREEGFLRSFAGFPLRKNERLYQRDIINSWKATILTHTHQEEVAVLESIEDYTRCYSVEFLKFLASDWKNDELTRLVERHSKAVNEGHERPLGRLERGDPENPLNLACGDPKRVRQSESLTDKEDYQRSVVLIAAHASKSLMTIGIAFVAALGVFVLSYRSRHDTIDHSTSVILLAIAAALTIISVISGFMAIGRAYKDGQRSADGDGRSWAIKPLRWRLNAQSLFGLAALGCFIVAVVSWNIGASTGLIEAPLVRMQRTIDGLTIRADQQADALRKVTQDVPGIVQTVTLLGQQVKRSIPRWGTF